MIGAVLQHWGYPPPVVDHVLDDAAVVRSMLERAYAEADLVISAGGASVGDHDFLPATAEALGHAPHLLESGAEAAKPLFFGVRDNRVHLALPGNPGAVLISLALHRAPRPGLPGRRR